MGKTILFSGSGDNQYQGGVALMLQKKPEHLLK